jgi:hypothetical protein
VKLRMYVPSWRTCLRWLEELSYGQAAGPKMGKVFGPYNHAVYGIHSEGDPVQSNVLTPRKMDTRNGGTRQRLSRQREKAARPYASAGRMAQEAKASL